LKRIHINFFYHFWENYKLRDNHVFKFDAGARQL